MKEMELTITLHGNNQLYIPISKKLEHTFKARDTVIVTVNDDDSITVKKK